MRYYFRACDETLSLAGWPIKGLQLDTTSLFLRFKNKHRKNHSLR